MWGEICGFWGLWGVLGKLYERRGKSGKCTARRFGQGQRIEPFAMIFLPYILCGNAQVVGDLLPELLGAEFVAVALLQCPVFKRPPQFICADTVLTAFTHLAALSKEPHGTAVLRLVFLQFCGSTCRQVELMPVLQYFPCRTHTKAEDRLPFCEHLLYQHSVFFLLRYHVIAANGHDTLIDVVAVIAAELGQVIHDKHGQALIGIGERITVFLFKRKLVSAGDCFQLGEFCHPCKTHIRIVGKPLAVDAEHGEPVALQIVQRGGTNILTAQQTGTEAGQLALAGVTLAIQKHGLFQHIAPNVGQDTAHPLEQEKRAQRRALGSYWNEGGWLFTQENGDMMNPCTPTRQFSKFLERNGFRHRKFHALRHTSATLLLYGGVSLKQVQGRLGHGDIETTNKYLHCLQEADEEAAGVLQSMLTVSRKPKPEQAQTQTEPTQAKAGA